MVNKPTLLVAFLFSILWLTSAADVVYSDDQSDIPIKLSGQFEITREQHPIRITRQELAAIPGFKTIKETLIPRAEPAELGVLPLRSFIAHFPLADDADGLLLETLNGWESFLPVDYIEEKDSLLLLYFNGQGPESGAWPYFGGDIEPLAPYYVFDPGEPIPRFPDSPKYGMIAATQISGIRAVNTADRYAPFFESPMDQLSELAVHGRTLFMQRCNGCHKGPGNVGGNVANRPFAVLHAHAKLNADYFKRVVVDPKQFYPNTAMPKHSDFNDASLEALVAFFREAGQLQAKE